ncbi:MAG: PD-(D/E)XK nuclease family protein [Porcipelethomonas sp.]
MVNFILGGAGCGKSQLLSKKISESAESDKKIIVIVPEQFSFDSDKKLYKILGAEKFNRILSLSFTSLAKDIFEKYGGRSGEYADDIQKYIIMNKVMRELSDRKALTFFGKCAEKVSFSEEALKLVTEFRQSGMSPDTIMDKLASDDASMNEKITDTILIYYTYDKMLKDSGLKDSLTDISESAAIANINEYFKDTIVFFDEFESFTCDEYDLIDTVISQADDVFISLRIENEGNNKYTIFDSVNNTWKKFIQLAEKYNVKTNTVHLEKPVKYISEDLVHLNLNILRPERKSFGESENIKIIECRDMYEEADYICSEINRLVKTENFRFSDIAVISRRLNDYIYVFEAAFKKYNIPYCINVKKSVMHTSIMQLVSSVLEIVSTDSPSSEFIFKYAKTQLNNFRQEDISALEIYCYEWSIDGKKWFEPFEYKSGSDFDAESIRKKIIGPIMHLKERCRTSDSSEICCAIYDFLEETNVPLKVYDICREFEEKNMIYMSKEMKRIWNLFVDTLDSVSEICGETDINNFREIFLMLLRQITYSVPPQTLDGVDVLCAETARPDSPKIVFVCGVNEGYFPASIKYDGILNEKDRIQLDSIGLSLSRSTEELISDEKLVVYKTLTYASDKLYISYPLSSLAGTSLFPAAVIKQIKDMYTDNIMEYASEKSLIFYSSTIRAAYYNYVRYFSEKNEETESIRKILEKNELYSTKIKFLEEIRNEKNIIIKDKELVKKLYSDKLKISATGFEEYNYCHFKFFCDTGLRLRLPQKREINKLEQGNLVHRCLEKVLSSCSDKEEFDNLTPDQISSLVRECSEEYFRENLGGSPAKTARNEMTLERINKGIEKLIEHLKEELKQSEFRPVDFELNLSNSPDGLPVLKADNGIEIVLRGVIDRVDMYEKNGQKYLRVIDYKTGEKKLSMSSIYYGINMQMLIYMFSVTGENAKYKDCNPVGVLYMPSGDIKCSRSRSDNTDIQKTLNSHYKMNGLVLNDRMILNAMEKDIMGVYIPASLTKEDTGEGLPVLSKNSSVLSWKQFRNLKRHTEELILDMCHELYDGNIDADPLISSKDDPCLYCGYWSVCGISETNKCREIKKESNELMLKKLSEGDEDDE